MNVHSKIVVITGGGSGIGFAIAEKFAELQSTVIIADIDEKKGIEAERKIPHSKYIHTDVRSKPSIDQMVEQVVEQFGRIDIFVNNAGVSRHQRSLEISEENWKFSIDLMLSGVFYCCQAAGKQMVKQGVGNIINITSINSTISIPGRLGYSCSKAAVLMMTKILAAEWATYQIRVNAVSPGVTLTPLVQDSVQSGLANVDNYLARTPMGRLATPEEIASAVSFIASDQASYITGNNLIVDGGWTSYHWTDIDHHHS